MIVTLLSLTLWFLCGMQAFVIFVRRMAKTTFDDGFGEGKKPCVRLEEKQWQVRFDTCWTDIGAVFILHTILGLGMLIYRVGEGKPPLQFNLGFRFVARDILPLEIARKLEGEEKKAAAPQPPAPPATQQQLSQQQQLALGQAFGQLAGGLPLQQGLPQPQFRQPPSKP